MTTFVGIDGEEIGQNTDARYALLCASNSAPLWNGDGLRTKAVLDYLLDAQEPREELVCFGLNYDVNQWLVDLPDAYLTELWDTGWCVWRGYRLEWAPARYLKITHRDTKRWATIQEPFGFFQTSFHDTLQRWGIEPPTKTTTGKRPLADITPTIRRNLTQHCQREAGMLVDLMGRVAIAADIAGCSPWPHTWIGSGALASTLLREHDVAPHHRHDADLTDQPATLEAVMTAYLGGRSEVFRQGVATSVQTFDIRSAYPSAARELPSLQGAKLVARRRYHPDAEHAVWRVSWRDAPGLVMPLPVRSEGAIWWPQNGSGWYHAAEIRAALHAGFELTIGEGYVLQYRNHSRPFGFLQTAYTERAALERNGYDAAAGMLKLATNSVYGKLAQGHSRAKTPRWQSYFWAGELTARIRARILEALLRSHRPVMVATDGIFAADAPIRSSARLGGWKVGVVDWVFAAKPGVYHARTAAGDVVKSSGFFSEDVDYDELLEGWRREGVEYIHEYTSNRFVGLGVALARDHPEQWRTWRDEHRALHLRPSRKNSVYTEDGSGITLSPKLNAPGPAEPYKRKERLLDPQDEDNAQGLDQPLRHRI